MPEIVTLNLENLLKETENWKNSLGRDHDSYVIKDVIESMVKLIKENCDNFNL